MLIHGRVEKYHKKTKKKNNNMINISYTSR